MHYLLLLIFFITHSLLAMEENSISLEIDSQISLDRNNISFLLDRVKHPSTFHNDDDSEADFDVCDIFSEAESAYNKQKSLSTIINKVLLENLVVMNDDQFYDFMMNMQLANGNTLLHEAAMHGDTLALNSLIDLYTIHNIFSDSDKKNSLSYFLENRNANMLTPFALAVQHHKFDVANRLLALGVHPNPYTPPTTEQTNIMNSLIVTLLYNNNIEGVRYLLLIDSDHKFLDDGIHTVTCVEKDNTENVTSLLNFSFTKMNEKDAVLDDIPFKNQSDIFYKEWSPEEFIPFVIAKTMQHHIPPQITSQFTRRLYNTPEAYNNTLQYCLRHSSIEILRTIIQDEKRFTLKDSPLLLLTALRQQIPDINATVAMLVENGAPLRATDEIGNSALHWAVQLPDDAIPVIRRLIRHKIPMNITNCDENTALDIVNQTKFFPKQQSRTLRHLLSLNGATTGRIMHIVKERKSLKA